MSGLFVITLLLATFTLSYLVAGGYRRYALRRTVLSAHSHAVPVPTGGGLAFVLPFLAVSLTFWFLERDALWLALVGGGGVVALLGWVGERYDLSAGVRVLVQGVAVAWALYWLGGLGVLSLGNMMLTLGWFGYPLAWLGVMGALNLYTSMDGVDGLVAGQGVLVAVTVGLLLSQQPAQPDLALACLTLGGALLGFLVWNWPPAKLALGDAGSSFLGFVFALLALSSENANALTLLGWLVLFAVFIVDGVATLIARRLHSGREYEHAYQKAVRAGFSPRQVVATVLLFGAVLGVITFVGALQPPLMLPLAASAFIVLFILWWAVSVREVLRGFTKRSK